MSDEITSPIKLDKDINVTRTIVQKHLKAFGVSDEESSALLDKAIKRAQESFDTENIDLTDATLVVRKHNQANKSEVTIKDLRPAVKFEFSELIDF